MPCTEIIPQKSKTPDVPWTPRQDAIIRQMRASGSDWSAIDKALGRQWSRQRLLQTLNEADPHPEAKPKPEKSAALRTIEALENLEPIPVTATEAVEWAERNKVALPDAGKVAAIQKARRDFGLPPFRLVQRATPFMEAKPQENEPMTAAPATKPQPVAKPAPTDATHPWIAMSQDELLQLVTEFSGTRTGVVTPEIARWLLALNTDNRPLVSNTVSRFEAILREGRWRNTGEPVIVSSQGILNDGQHRLTAIVRSGVRAEMDVRFGIDRSAFQVTGTGTKRTSNHVLAMAGHKHSAMQASIARIVIIHDMALMAQNQIRVDSDLILRAVDEQPLIARVAAVVTKFKFAPARTAAFAAMLTIAARTAPLSDVVAFAEIVAGKLCERESIAPRRLHVRLRDEAIAKRRVPALDVAIMTVKAWNAYSAGEEISQIKITDADRASATFPAVIPARKQK